MLPATVPSRETASDDGQPAPANLCTDFVTRERVCDGCVCLANANFGCNYRYIYLGRNRRLRWAHSTAIDHQRRRHRKGWRWCLILFERRHAVTKDALAVSTCCALRIDCFHPGHHAHGSNGGNKIAQSTLPLRYWRRNATPRRMLFRTSRILLSPGSCRTAAPTGIQHPAAPVMHTGGQRPAAASRTARKTWLLPRLERKRKETPWIR